MLPGLGEKYADVATAILDQGNKHVAGVVVDVFGGIWKTKNKSSSITFTIKDRDLNNGHTWDGLRIKYFSGNESQLPPVELGDVVLLKNLYVGGKSVLWQSSESVTADEIIADSVPEREADGRCCGAEDDPLGHLA